MRKNFNKTLDNGSGEIAESFKKKMPELLSDNGITSFENNLIRRHAKTKKLLDYNSKKTLNCKSTQLSYGRCRNMIIRAIFCVILISYLLFTIYLGPLAIMATTLAIQVKCFSEIIDIGYSVYPINGMPWFRSLSWYFLVVANYLFYGESTFEYFTAFFLKYENLRIIIDYHRFFSFCLYFIGVMWFVLSLVRKYDIEQFSLWAWTHVALLIIVTQSYMIVKNIFQGLIWLFVPVTMVVCNDITAYLVGSFCGKTPLIELSPKKTWEGFVGGGVCTIIYGFIISYILCQFPYLVCPVEYGGQIKINLDCEPNDLFILTKYPVSFRILKLISMNTYFYMYPFVWHSVVFSLFSSLIAPFGGFFASGFKRAFQVKDFGETIPGHGGILDRFDCQFLMATFVNVYITSFISVPSPEIFYSKVLYMRRDQQRQFYYLLQQSLINRKLLNV